MGLLLLSPHAEAPENTAIDRMRAAIAEIGGEPLDGSGFENEKPDEGFSGAVLLDSTFVPLKPNISQ
jgi:hypothetical protein